MSKSIIQYLMLMLALMMNSGQSEATEMEAPVAISKEGIKNTQVTAQKGSADSTVDKNGDANLSNAERNKTQHQQRQSGMQPSANSHYYFSVYDASTWLLTDVDYDGFYREFSVVFDVDVEVGSADIYAEIYLSREGGPWEHLYTTDVFRIHGQQSADEYEVITTLVSGYPTAHYNVLIDVYEYGYPELMATYSSYDDNDLYALPLEMADLDYYYEEPVAVSHGHGGSLSVYALTLLSVMGLWRRRMASANSK